MSIIQSFIGTNLTISADGGGGGSSPGADFTIEWWQKVENNSQNSRPWSIGLYPTQVMAVSYESHTSDYFWINNSPVGNTLKTHVGQGWEHMVYTRIGGTVVAYLNGRLYFAVNISSLITDSTTPLYVGTGELGAGMFRGYITDLHIMKGVGKYPGGFTFTPPTSPIVAQTGSVFLLPAVDDTTKFTDTVGFKSASVTGTPTWSADSPYGGSNGSLYFDSSSYLNFGSSIDWAIDV